jgi:hypothetical protein
MSVLLDTNILTRSAQPDNPMQKTALDALSILKTRREDLCIVPQNLVEFCCRTARCTALRMREATNCDCWASFILQGAQCYEAQFGLRR